MKLIPSLAAAALVGACASPPSEAPSSSPGMDDRLAKAAVTPLNDLNLVQGQIPPVLVAARKAPYAVPADVSCPALASAVQALDAVLGADLDTPVTPTNPSLIERGGTAAGDAVASAVQNTAEGVIPFRGWVRKLSGAERYSRDVASAIAAGVIRRAYLKGLGQSAGCEAPAAPAASGR